MKRFALAALLVLIGCASSEALPSDSSNLSGSAPPGRVFSTAKTKKLDPPVPVPRDTDIGRTIDEVLAAHGATEVSRTSDSHVDERGIRVTVATVIYRSSSNARLTFERSVMPPVPKTTTTFYEGHDILWASVDAESTESWAHYSTPTEGALDGKIQRYGSEATGRSYEDGDKDGLVDLWVEPIASLPGFVIEGYGDCIPPSPAGSRILQDTDHDGRFDSESVTAKSSEKALWSCAK